MPEMYGSREVETGLGIKPATLRHYADRLHVAPHGRSGKARQWTFTDIVLILIAQSLVDRRNFATPIAIELAQAMEPALVPLTVDENASAWLVAWPDLSRPGRHHHKLCFNAKDALDAMDPSLSPMAFDVRPWVEEAVRLGFAARGHGSEQDD
ncbi:MAG: MerR family transcriptional regulator [Rhizobiaceae bacterium]|nr:MerR family transcriptional regulator [Rhizobiaceae bacterium]